MVVAAGVEHLVNLDLEDVEAAFRSEPINNRVLHGLAAVIECRRLQSVVSDMSATLAVCATEREVTLKHLGELKQELDVAVALGDRAVDRVKVLEAQLAEKRCGCGGQSDLTKLPSGAIVCGTCRPIHARIAGAKPAKPPARKKAKKK